MRQTHLFTKTRKEAPADEVSKNAELLIRGGFIHKEMAGVYSYLPLGFRVIAGRGNRTLVLSNEFYCQTFAEETWRRAHGCKRTLRHCPAGAH